MREINRHTNRQGGRNQIKENRMNRKEGGIEGDSLLSTSS